MSDSEDDDIIAAPRRSAAAAAAVEEASASEGEGGGGGGGGSDSSSGSGDDSGSGSESGSGSGSGSGGESASIDEEAFVRKVKKKPTRKRPVAPAYKRRPAAKKKKYDDDIADEGQAERYSDDEEEQKLLQGMTRKEYEQKRYEAIKQEAEKMRARAAKEKTAEEQAAALEAKYRAGGYKIGAGDVEDYLEEEEGEEAGDTNAPSITDPKLWMIRCREGSEAAVVIALMNKFVAMAEQGTPLDIMSVTSSTKSVVFVEAFREASVKVAITNIADLYGWKPGAIKVVPVEQMTSSLRVVATREIFDVGNFVRMTRGIYKGDLAQVVKPLDNEKLLIRCVPRLDLRALGDLARAAGGEEGGARRGRPAFGRSAAGAPRPPQRLYDREEVNEAVEGGSGGIAAVELRNKWGRSQMHFFHGNFYDPRSRLLLKEVTSSAITGKDVAPTLEEIPRFPAEGRGGGGSGGFGGGGEDGSEEEEEGEEGEAGRQRRAQRSSSSSGAAGSGAVDGEEERLLAALIAAKSRSSGLSSCALAAGDSVRVVAGDLSGLTGKVVAINQGDTFTLAPSVESAAALGLDEDTRLEVPLDEAIKTFEPGDHVKVYSGIYNGETGTVVEMVEPLGGGAGGGGGGAGSSSSSSGAAGGGSGLCASSWTLGASPCRCL